MRAITFFSDKTDKRLQLHTWDKVIGHSLRTIHTKFKESEIG